MKIIRIFAAAIAAVVVVTAAAGVTATASLAPERMSPGMRERLEAGIEVIGIVHWGLNTYTDREWGFGSEKPSLLDPDRFDADAIAGAAAAGGIQGLVVVAKHHDGFCLWPTKTTEYNISKSPFRGGRGDYVGEMCAACRKAGLRFGVYCSPWDRNNADYATEKYVETYREQLRELNDGRYGEIFEMWFDGANGGDGWYGGAAGGKGETRRISGIGYYRFDELFAMIRSLQPKVCFFGAGGDFAWPGNERGYVDPALDASDAEHFRMWEADFPLRRSWFYHDRDRGTARSAAYLMKLYLMSVGNGGIMNIGLSPDRHGRLAEEDVKALAGFGVIKRAFFAKEVTTTFAEYNVVVEIRDHRKYIKVLDEPMKMSGRDCAYADRAAKRYLADPELVRLVREATSKSGETDTAKWMTGAHGG